MPKNKLCESIDSSVQNTNDEATVSKRSSVKNGYFDDPYLRFFSKKYSRRSSMINRGYYLRNKSVAHAVTSAIDAWIRQLDRKFSTSDKQRDDIQLQILSRPKKR